MRDIEKRERGVQREKRRGMKEKNDLKKDLKIYFKLNLEKTKKGFIFAPRLNGKERRRDRISE